MLLMFQKIDAERHLWRWIWPALVGVVLLSIAGIQMLRVNPPQPAPANTIGYTAPGALISDALVIPAGEFYSHRLDLNRKAKLSGEFQTGSVKALISILVLNETNFENWQAGRDYSAFARTGNVPGGKIAPVLEPGVYFLIVDNRSGDSTRTVRTRFVID